MRVLIVGNDPTEIGGVANYTRPLATAFSKMGHEVFYLYSGAFASRYDWRMKPYVKLRLDGFPFEQGEIVNSTCLPFNYGDPDRDVSDHDMEKVITAYLDRVRPDIMHVHSRLGLPFSINRLATARGITVVNTIHVYGYLCQKRVMIDHTGAPCPGPVDLMNCAACTGSQDRSVELRRARIRSLKEVLRKRSGRLYAFVRGAKNSAGIAWTPGVTSPTGATARQADPLIAQRLTARLSEARKCLNSQTDLVLCVSNDVKRTLMRFGVREEPLLVQHIGSVIAERQTVSDRRLHKPLTIGNIGGVNYYKGTHVLLDALGKVTSKDFIVKIFGKYDERYMTELMAGREGLPVQFTGRYQPEELPEILKQVDVMVLPSICNDTAPQTIFESFSSGIPIIASKIGGFPDFVSHDVNGLLFAPGDSDDLARALDHLLANRDKIAQYKANIPKLKTICENARELISLYEDLLHEKNEDVI